MNPFWKFSENLWIKGKKLTREKSKNISTADIVRSCFIDTGIFFAAYNKRDAMHTDASYLLTSTILGSFGNAYTSTYVLDEVLTLTKAKIGSREAVKLAEIVMKSKKISVINVEDREGKTLADAFIKFRKYLEVESLSFTDCTTLAIQGRMKIEAVLSFDRDFLPFVTRLLGEGYHNTLSEDEKQILAKATETLGIEI